MSTCETCSRWAWTPEYGDMWGLCSLQLPPWVNRSLNKAGGVDYQQHTRRFETCSFHDQVEMEGDAETIHGWGGQGA